MRHLKYIYESSDYSFESLFNKVKLDFPEFNIKFKEQYDKMIIEFDGKEEFTSDIINKIKKIIQFLKDNYYEIKNPLNIIVKFKSNSVVYNSGTLIENEDDLLKLIGKKDLLSIEFECRFADANSLNKYTSVIREIQRDITSVNNLPFNTALKDKNGSFIYDDGRIKYKYETFDVMLQYCPNFNYEGKEYWFLNSSLYNQSKSIKEHESNYLVTKINNTYKIIGLIKVLFKDKKYSISEIFILPTFRRKEYSFIMNKFVQEKTGLNYSTDSFKTKLGHYQMIRNKRLLKYESFNK